MGARERKGTRVWELGWPEYTEPGLEPCDRGATGTRGACARGAFSHWEGSGGAPGPGGMGGGLGTQRSQPRVMGGRLARGPALAPLSRKAGVLGLVLPSS